MGALDRAAVRLAVVAERDAQVRGGEHRACDEDLDDTLGAQGVDEPCELVDRRCRALDQEGVDQAQRGALVGGQIGTRLLGRLAGQLRLRQAGLECAGHPHRGAELAAPEARASEPDRLDDGRGERHRVPDTILEEAEPDELRGIGELEQRGGSDRLSSSDVGQQVHLGLLWSVMWGGRSSGRDQRRSVSCARNGTPIANATVPSPTVPPSCQPSTREDSSRMSRTSQTG